MNCELAVIVYLGSPLWLKRSLSSLRQDLNDVIRVIFQNQLLDYRFYNGEPVLQSGAVEFERCGCLLDREGCILGNVGTSVFWSYTAALILLLICLSQFI